MKKLEEHPHFKIGLTAFGVIAASIVLYFSIARFGEIASAFARVLEIMQPFLIGLAIAYLMCPLFNLVRRKSLKVKWPQFFISKKDGKVPYFFFSQFLATVVTLITMFTVVAGLLWMIIPQLIDSILKLVTVIPSGIDTFLDWINKITADQKELSNLIDQLAISSTDNLVKWIEETLIVNYNTYLEGLSSGIIGTFGFVLDIFVAVIICVFFLNSKEIFAAQTKKTLFSLVSKEKADDILKGAVFTNRTFSGFINGKLLDSLIIGVICFIVMAIFNWPFAALISVIIGITNIIPFFGPFIGAIPSTILVMMVEPILGLYFLIFILILQQVDGNIIGPKILGNSTGLPSIWVLFAILVGGGLFGFLGMILGIPVFAVIYAYICYVINKRLKKKGLSLDLNDYKYAYKEKIAKGDERPKVIIDEDKEEKKKDILERTPIDKTLEKKIDNSKDKASKEKKDHKTGKLSFLNKIKKKEGKNE